MSTSDRLVLRKGPAAPEATISMDSTEQPLPSGRSIRSWIITVDQGRTRVVYRTARDGEQARTLFDKHVSDYRRAGYR